MGNGVLSANRVMRFCLFFNTEYSDRQATDRTGMAGGAGRSLACRLLPSYRKKHGPLREAAHNVVSNVGLLTRGGLPMWWGVGGCLITRRLERGMPKG